MRPRNLEQRLFILFLSICCSWFSLFSNAQTLPPEVTTFPPSAFEAHNQILCVENLPDGRTAFGTAEKVLVYDGESFRNIPVGSGKIVFSMARGPDGRLFVGGQSLMGVIEADSSGTLTYRSLLPMLPDSLREFGIIWRTISSGNGSFYFDAFDQIFRYKDDSLQVIRPENRFFWMHRPSSQPIVEDDDSGLFRLRGTEKEYLEGSKGLEQGKGIRAILPSPEDSGEWTVFTGTNGLFHYDPKEGAFSAYPQGPSYTPKRGWAAVKINSVCRLDPEKNPYEAAFAVGTRRRGLYLLSSEGRIALHLGKQEGIPARYIWRVAPTGGGDFWATTNNGIALIHTGLPFTSTREGDLFSGSVRDIERQTPQGSPLFLATAQATYSWDRASKDFKMVSGTAGQCWDLLLSPMKKE